MLLCFPSKKEFEIFEDSSLHFANFIRNPNWKWLEVERYDDNYVHDHHHNRNETDINAPTLSTIKYGSIMIYLLFQKLFDFPESMCLALAIPLLGVAKQFGDKISTENSFGEVILKIIISNKSQSLI